nr:MAG TPA: hypothetical protein [Bacteriophage sp.]
MTFHFPVTEAREEPKLFLVLCGLLYYFVPFSL